MERIITKVEDSFGAKLYEGDIIEYYIKDSIRGEIYFEEGYTKFEKYPITRINELPIGYEDRAIKKGYTCKQIIPHDYKYINDEATKRFAQEPEVLMFKPLYGIVKWNSEHITYEPLMEVDEFNCSIFISLLNKYHDDKYGTRTYIKKIGNILDNPELLDLIK